MTDFKIIALINWWKWFITYVPANVIQCLHNDCFKTDWTRELNTCNCSGLQSFKNKQPVNAKLKKKENKDKKRVSNYFFNSYLS